MTAAWLDYYWKQEKLPKDKRWNRLRCDVYVATLSVSSLFPIDAFPKAYFYWFVCSPTMRALALIAAQLEVGGRFGGWVALLVTSTLIAIDPPFDHSRRLFYRLQAILYGLGFLTGIPKIGRDPLRWMLSTMAILEVIYFTGGWTWPIWWLFPVAQTLVRLAAWRCYERPDEAP